MIGNALPPPFIKAHALSLRRGITQAKEAGQARQPKKVKVTKGGRFESNQ